MEIKPATDNQFATVEVTAEDERRVAQIGADVFIGASINPADIGPLIFEEDAGDPAPEAAANAS
jgi:hypothetical protein